MGGGRSKWKEHFNQYFKDARVIILPDNDLTGKEHAENIIKNLTGIAKEIKLINLPDLKEKGDITDWIQAGHDKKELFEIINNTAPYEAEEKEKKSKITPVEPLQKNEKSYSIEEVREEIKKIIHSDSQENILIKTLAGSGKTVTILKEINSITEENKKYKNCFTLTSKHFNYLTRKKEEDSKEVKEYKDFLRKTLKPLKNVIFDRYINMFQALKEKIYSYFNNEKNTIEAINEIMFNSSFKNHRFAYSSPFLKNIEELQKSGILDPSMWKIIKSRELKDDKNPAGNCYKKKEIDKLIERRINPTLRLCNNVDCPHYQECFSDKDMYLGQWQEKEKHIALSHKMLAMARGRLKDIHQIIIDENPLTAFLEKIDIVNTIKLEDKDRNKIDLAITEFEKSYSLDDKKALPLFKAIRNIIKNLLLSGRKEKKHICLTGSKFIEKFKEEYYKESYKDLNSIFDIPDIRENDSYHFRQELHELIKEEITKYNNSNDDNKEYNSRIYFKYFKPVKNSPERIELYFRNKLELKQNYKSIIALDATTDTLIWNKLLDEEFKEVKYNILLPAGYKHIQNISGKYGKNYHDQCMRESEKRKLIDNEIELFQSLGGHEKVALFGFKSVIECIAKKLNLETDEEIGSNFYGIKGSNHYQNYEIALILGTSNMNMNELKELTITLFHDEEKINFATEEKEVRYNTNINNKDYTIKIDKAIDKRYDAMWSNFREGELTQVANRVRPLLSAKTIISMSNVPLSDLPPTELLTLNEMLSKFKKEKALKMAENNGKIEFSNITPAPQDNEKEEKESDNKGLTNSVNFEFNDLLKNVLWFCEKYKQILISLFQEKERLEKVLKNGVDSQCQRVTKVLYNIDRKEIENNHKNILSLIALLLHVNTIDFTSFLLLSKDKMFYQRLYEKFIKLYNLKSQKGYANLNEKGKILHYNISFSPSSSSEELDINVIKAEYEKFNKYKEKGKVLDMIIPSFSSFSFLSARGVGGK